METTNGLLEQLFQLESRHLQSETHFSLEEALNHFMKSLDKSDTHAVEQVGETQTLSYMELQYVMSVLVQDSSSSQSCNTDSPTVLNEIIPVGNGASYYSP